MAAQTNRLLVDAYREACYRHGPALVPEPRLLKIRAKRQKQGTRTKKEQAARDLNTKFARLNRIRVRQEAKDKIQKLRSLEARNFELLKTADALEQKLYHLQLSTIAAPTRPFDVAIPFDNSMYLVPL
jgi:hypothetical protein